jgi:hypothetical protein
VRRILIASAAGFAALAAPAAALGPLPFGPSLAAVGWQSLTFRGRPPAEFLPAGPDTLAIRSDAGVSVIWKALSPDFASGSAASWRWRVDAGVPPTDLSDRTADDRSIALYFLFGNDASVVENPPTSLRGAVARGRALIYVWGGEEARGSVVPAPAMFGRGQIVVSRPADSPTGAWLSEAVDLRADFRRVFGREPGPLVGVGVSSDSDNTGTRTEAVLADLEIR